MVKLAADPAMPFVADFFCRLRHLSRGPTGLERIEVRVLNKFIVSVYLFIYLFVFVESVLDAIDIALVKKRKWRRQQNK